MFYLGSENKMPCSGSVLTMITPASITFTSPTTLEYESGDVMDTAGFSAVLTYDDGTTEDVTAACTLSPADGEVLSAADITFAATYDWPTKLDTFRQTKVWAIDVVEVEEPIVEPELITFTVRTYGGSYTYTDTVEVGTTWNDLVGSISLADGIWTLASAATAEAAHSSTGNVSADVVVFGRTLQGTVYYNLLDEQGKYVSYTDEVRAETYTISTEYA